MTPIVPVSLSIPLPSATPAVTGTSSATADSAFSSVFQEAVSKVESFSQNAQASIGRFLSGEGEELHQVALKTQEADLSFELFLQARNKIVAAYQEVMRMQV